MAPSEATSDARQRARRCILFFVVCVLLLRTSPSVRLPTYLSVYYYYYLLLLYAIIFFIFLLKLRQKKRPRRTRPRTAAPARTRPAPRHCAPSPPPPATPLPPPPHSPPPHPPPPPPRPPPPPLRLGRRTADESDDEARCACVVVVLALRAARSKKCADRWYRPPHFVGRRTM